MIKMGSFTGLSEKSSRYTHLQLWEKALWAVENKTQQWDTAAATNRSSPAIGHPKKLYTLCTNSFEKKRNASTLLYTNQKLGN